MLHLLAYAVTFAAAAVVCLFGLPQAGRLESDEAVVGLRVLLSVTALWAGLQAITVLVSVEYLVPAFFLVAQAVGFATVGAWMYFCSAYAGYDYHKRPIYWVAGISLYGVVAFLKLTETLHGAYFGGRVVTEPFPHLYVDPTVLFWSVLGVSYVLIAAGFYMLFSRFNEADRLTTTITAFAIATVVPVVPTIIAFARPASLVPFHYEPLGIAMFAIGTLYVADSTFIKVHEQSENAGEE